jgi:uncharacterized protein
MKVINYVRYVSDLEKVASIRPAHRAFMSKLGEQNHLIAGGPFSDGSGALFIYEVDTLQDAEAIFAQDPYTLGGVIASHNMHAWGMASVYPDLFTRVR